MERSLARIWRRPRILVVLWILTAVFTWAGLLASLPGYYSWFIRQPIELGFNAQQLLITIAGGVASLLCSLTSIALGTLIFLRRRDDFTALFVSFYLLLYGFIIGGAMEMLEYLLLSRTGVYAFRSQSVIFPSLSVLMLLIFPNGKITPAWFRALIPLTLLTAPAMAMLPDDQYLSFATLPSQLAYGLIGGLFLLALGGQVYRYRKVSTLIERQQTKIILYGLAVQFVLLAISSAFYFQLTSEQQNTLRPEYLLGMLVWFFTLTITPIVFTLAVIRWRLWDIDVVIRRTLVYGFLTAVLALLYFVSVVFFQYGFRLMAGHESPIAIVLSTLAIAGLFTPLRLRIQAAIDRRFYRSKYNSEQALARFQRSMRERTDLNQVEDELSSIVQVTVQPEWLSVWIRKATKE